LILTHTFFKKSLEILEGVYRGKTDNTMAKRKEDKQWSIKHKLKIEQQSLHSTEGDCSAKSDGDQREVVVCFVE
jgi:hypothetical protein